MEKTSKYKKLDHVAFPLGGIGAGMMCLEGTGAISHLSIRNRPDLNNEPFLFSAVCIKGRKNIARVLEGPVPAWKYSCKPGYECGLGNSTYGLPRFSDVDFCARFPFSFLELRDSKIPLKVKITAWSPFMPPDADNSSLPVSALEYSFRNTSRKKIDAVYSFTSKNFMSANSGADSVMPLKSGFILAESGSREKPWEEGYFCAIVDNKDAGINYAGFRGGWFDFITAAWKDIESGKCIEKKPLKGSQPSPGATIYVPLKLNPGEEKTLKLMFSWYVPGSNINEDWKSEENKRCDCGKCGPVEFYKPWYTSRFSGINEISGYWKENYDKLLKGSKRFSDCFYDTSLPGEAIEAVSANLSILKSPTVLRQRDGRLWCWEGCASDKGCCLGSCTHVWNYAQAIPHLFPELERTLRETEFNECQDAKGHQSFRASLPIRKAPHDFHAAADGQLGGIMKVYRDWRISGDNKWLLKLWPRVRQSMDYCIEAWDPGHTGALQEPHHNTYDIEFWGPDGMCTSFYLGALLSMIIMGNCVKEDVSLYSSIFEKGRKYIEGQLYNGEYFFQKIQWKGLKADDPTKFKAICGNNYSPEAIELLKKEGPKYQYGSGCLSDGILGAWIAFVCGLPEFIDRNKIISHLKSVYRYNFRMKLSGHVNPQRPGYASAGDGGLLLCSWPKGKQPTLPFVYSNEVWTGIEYQSASHMIANGLVREGLQVVRTLRKRYDGSIRNPFNEYECGAWYARAMSSYSLLQAFTGVRYDALEKTLYIKPVIKGNFRCFLSTASGYATVGLRKTKPFIENINGYIDIRSFVVVIGDKEKIYNVGQ